MDKVDFNYVRTDRGLNILPGRASGKTTKIIDNAIKLLFEDRKIQVRDYEEEHVKAPTLDERKALLEKIETRLESEHGLGEGFELKSKVIEGQLYAWLEAVEEEEAKDLADFNKAELCEYLTQKEVEHDPRDLKAVLLELAVTAHDAS